MFGVALRERSGSWMRNALRREGYRLNVAVRYVRLKKRGENCRNIHEVLSVALLLTRC